MWAKKSFAFFILKQIVNIALLSCSFSVIAKNNTFLLTHQENQWIKSHPKITVGFDGYFPPFSYLTDQGKIQGYSVDYFKLLAKKTGLNMQITPVYTWQSLYKAAQQKKIDVVATMVNKPKRQKWFLFTSPYIFKSLAIVTRKNDHRILTRDDIANKTVALVKDYQYVEDIKKTLSTLKPYYINNIHEGLEAVSAEHADAMISFTSAMHWYRKKYLINNVKVAAFYDKNSANESIAIRKDWPILQQILIKKMNSISQQELEKLANKWLPESSVKKNYDEILKVASLFFVIIILLFIWNMLFRFKNKQIKKAQWRTEQANYQLTQLKNSLEQQIQQRTKELFQLSYFDKITKIANRNSFYKQAEHLLKQSTPEESHLALITIDVNRFKNINDTLSHKIGNQVLKEIANRITENRAAKDIVARYGGDEFTLILSDVDYETALPEVRKLLARLHQPFLVYEQPLGLSFNIGVALYPNDGLTVNELLQHAETAMFKAKEENSGVEFYQLQHFIHINDYLQLEQALLSAINEIEQTGQSTHFRLHYQPIKWVHKAGIKGFEALIRWQHPELGTVDPEQFIHLAEDIGKIKIISQWVIKTALKQAKIWYELGIEFGRISVNISATELQHNDFITQLKKEIVEINGQFEWLEIEVTETAILKNPQHAIALLKELQQLGASISIDDFGTGYSSLVYLKKIPSNTVKIDREFIKNLPQAADDIAINKSIIQLCQAFEKTTVAEGVETLEQLDLLVELGCDAIQGYFIAKPMPQENVHKSNHYFKLSMDEFSKTS